VTTPRGPLYTIIIMPRTSLPIRAVKFDPVRLTPVVLEYSTVKFRSLMMKRTGYVYCWVGPLAVPDLTIPMGETPRLLKTESSAALSVAPVSMSALAGTGVGTFLPLAFNQVSKAEGTAIRISSHGPCTCKGCGPN